MFVGTNWKENLKKEEKNEVNLPLALGLVKSFCTILSYAISSATPESLTSFSLTAIQILCLANRSSSSSNAYFVAIIEIKWEKYYI